MTNKWHAPKTVFFEGDRQLLNEATEKHKNQPQASPK
jgi:hypothetical protein